MYQVQILDAATRDLARLDPSVGRRIVKRINWLAAHVETIRLEALTGELGRLYKLRIGDYRVIYEPLHAEQCLITHVLNRGPGGVRSPLDDL